MKLSLLIATLLATAATGAFAGPGPIGHGASIARTQPSAVASAKCASMLLQPVSGKTQATTLNCSAATVKASALCRAHCG